MAWNPDLYNRFKNERAQPFYDLIAHIEGKPEMTLLDLGCGTGELTRVAADRLATAKALGIDNSAEMLSKARPDERLSFENRTIPDQLNRDEQWDVILANASLQWIDNHQALFPQIISRLRASGQLAVQMPSQKENVLNRLLHDLVLEAPYHEKLAQVIRYSPVLSLDEYTFLLISNGAKTVNVYQKVYPIIADTTDTLYDFIAGSSLGPYLQHLEDPLLTSFEADFRKRIAAAFDFEPKVYAFKRIILVAQF